jgi:eukaryotic-like serine/threonine-protein kinase
VPFIVMEFVDGRTLRDILDEQGTIAPRRALEIGTEICAALEFSHRRGVVHRDISPGNVMISKTGSVKVMDFGVARAGDGGSTLTTATSVIGSALYHSPEQCRGEAGSARSDIYATGCVVYEMLCGAPPFTGTSPIAVASRHVREAPRPPSEVRQGVPRGVDAVILKALSKNPANRQQTAAELRRDLARAMMTAPATATLSIGERETVTRTAPIGAASDAAVATGGRAAPPVNGPLLLAPVVTFPAGDGEADHIDGPPTRRVSRMAALVAVCVCVIVALALTIMVITTPLPPPKVSVPDLSGLGLPEATAVLREKQLTLGSVKQVDSPKNAVGQIVSQRPSELTEVEQGAAVDVEIDSS